MQVISLVTSKGGSGRTNALLVMAAGFVFHDKRVLVIDTSASAKTGVKPNRSSFYRSWQERMEGGLIDAAQLKLASCWTDIRLAEMLAAAEQDGVDIVLLDARLANRRMLEKVSGRSDLIIASAETELRVRRSLEKAAEYCTHHRLRTGLLVNSPNFTPNVTDDLSTESPMPVSDSDLFALDVIAQQVSLEEFAYTAIASPFYSTVGRLEDVRLDNFFWGALARPMRNCLKNQYGKSPYVSPQGNAYKVFQLKGQVLQSGET